VIDFSISSQLIKSKEVLFKIEVEIGFYITKSNWVIEEEALKFTTIGFVFDQQKTIKIKNDVIQFVTYDLLHVNFDFRLEIVQSVQKCSYISLERPTSISSSYPIHQFIEWESLLKLAHIHLISVVNKTCQYLEVSD
jgi:hypothetical protein